MDEDKVFLVNNKIELALSRLRASILQQLMYQDTGVISGTIDVSLFEGGVRDMKLSCSFNQKLALSGNNCK